MSEEAETLEAEKQPTNPIEDITSLLLENEGIETEDESEQDDTEEQSADDDIIDEVAETLEADDDDESDTEDETEEGFSLSDLAEKLEVDKADLYSVEIPIGDGVNATLGELKDAFKDVETINQDRENLELERVKSQNESMVARDQLSKLMGLIGDVPQEALDYVEGIHQAELKEAGSKILGAIPSWSDPKAIESDMNSMSDHLKAYGFTKHDLNRVTDHRLMAYIRDNMRRETQTNEAKARLKKGKKAPKTLKSAGKKVGKNAAQARLHKAAKAGNAQAQQALVVDLIK